MATGGPIPMTTELPAPSLLILAQWFSPAFPIGAFSFSHGLEAMVQSGAVTEAAAFRGWIDTVLHHGAGRSDLILMAAAFRADSAAALQEVDAEAQALAASAERLTETEEQGRSFVRTINQVWDTELPPLCYPVAIGAAARACGLPLAPVAQMYLHALVSNLTSAAIRLVPLGQTEGQAIIRALAPLCETLSHSALEQPLDAIGNCAFLADIASMQHETQYSRMFRS